MRSSLFVLGLLAVVACQSEGEEEVGAISLAVAAAPAGAACLRVTVTGGSGGGVERKLGLYPGKATSGTLSGLPLGQVTVKAEAMTVACPAVNESSIPSWVSNQATALLTPGTAVPVQLVMQKAGQISVAVDWNTGGGGSGGSGGSGGTAGKGGAGGTSAGGKGGGGAVTGVADALNGQLLTAPCLGATGERTVCLTNKAGTACPVMNPMDPALSGVLTTDKTVTLGGNAGTTYAISLHVQGEVESKTYTGGGPDQNSVLESPRADGFYTGGKPTPADNYGVWMLRVTNPDGTRTDHFLNSLSLPGVSDHTTYGIDYSATIKAQGGATVRLVSADSNCAMIRNCGPVFDGMGCTNPIAFPEVEPAAKEKNPSFDFTSPYDGQWISMAVTKVVAL